jgi:Bifunctional DNA primase/polymerase, N-terminal/AAA domain/Primase C terminal 1 (PriCT-1)
VSLEAALTYACAGWPVFPLDGKIPRTRHGFKDATTDLEQIEKWWSVWPDAGVGTPTGSGRVVLDVDNEAAVEELPGRPPPTVEALTGGGGRHLWFRHDGRLTNSPGRLPNGIHFRGDGGYVVLPPSRHPDGGTYEWLTAPDEMPMATVPGWLLDLLKSAQNGVAPAIPGEIPRNERNVTMTSLAGTMRRRGMTEKEILAALLETNKRCVPPLDEHEVLQIARSVARYQPAEKETSLPIRSARSEVSPLHQLDVKTMLETEPEPTDWLADKFAARSAFAIFGGREKRGKSMVLLAIAVTAANGGGQVGGIGVKPARVLIIDAENGKKLIHARLIALGLRSDDNIEIYEARGFELRSHLHLIREKIREGKFDLIILDSYRSLWLGDERDEKENVEALDPLRNLAHDENVAIVLSHHAQKGGDEYRGSSAIGACVDWLVMIEKVHRDDDRTRKRLTVPLPRIDAEPDPRWIRIESDGATITISSTEEYEGVSGQALEAVIRKLKSYNSNNEWRSADWGALACAEVCADTTFKRKHLSELKKRKWVETTTLARLREAGFEASPDADGRKTWFRFTDDWWLLNWSSTHE